MWCSCKSLESKRICSGSRDFEALVSRSKSFGDAFEIRRLWLTGLEALSAGLPVLVSGTSGFGEALCSLPFGSLFVITSDDPADWTSAIEKICAKDWNCRLEEAESLRHSYDRKYNWRVQIEVLINKMISWGHGMGFPLSLSLSFMIQTKGNLSSNIIKN